MKFSIIVPCYNQSDYLDDCLESITAQTYTNWECIIVNDGSKDKTEEFALEWVKKDKRISYLFKENGGLSSARNTGIRKSCGDYILPLDADDKISSTYLEKAMLIFKDNPKIALVYGRANFFGDIDKEWTLPEYNYANLLYGNQIYCSSIYKRELYELSNGYDESMKSGFEDWDFLIRTLDQRIVYKLKDIVFFYRIKKNSMMQDLNTNKIKHFQVKKYIYGKNLEKHKKYWPIFRYLHYLRYEFLITIFTIKKWIQIKK